MELVFEIGCEELPASFIRPALEEMKALYEEACREARLDPGQVEVAGTPRRLAMWVGGGADRQEDLEEERTGPPAQVAFKDGAPTGAAQGFARGQGVAVEDLYTVTTDKGEYVAARVFEEGKAAAEMLPEILTGIFGKLHFPKSMRWGSGKETFARPVRWILAVCDGAVVPVEFAGVKSGGETRGHRFVAPEARKVSGVEEYLAGLEEASVVLDGRARKKTIEASIAEHAEAVGGRVVEDPALVDEVAHLVELPLAVTLGYDEKYLELPREVLISSMRSHQRYFAVERTDGSALLPACVVIYNTPVRDPQVVADGNLRVLRARLDDARFFWEKDLGVRQEDRLDALKSVIWIGPLGSMRDRSARMSSLAGGIARALGLDEGAREAASRAALLSKTDLVSQLVDEFPDLQGVMGREYALKAGEDEAVAQAIGEQYLPGGPEDPVPSTEVASCVALAEKLDAIVGCFGVGMVPDSTKDPYGLRRSALGVLRILAELEEPLELTGLVELARDAYRDSHGKLEGSTADVVEFLTTRLHFLLLEQAPTDVVKAVLATGVTDVPSVHGRIAALDELRHREDFEPLALGFKRVVNILKKQAQGVDLVGEVDPGLFEDGSEEALFGAYRKSREALDSLADARDWRGMLEALIELKGPVDAFFDGVMVMADDEAVRVNRLRLLEGLRSIFFRVADISQVQG